VPPRGGGAIKCTKGSSWKNGSKWCHIMRKQNPRQSVDWHFPRLQSTLCSFYQSFDPRYQSGPSRFHRSFPRNQVFPCRFYRSFLQ
jgi:hypothetical protein